MMAIRNLCKALALGALIPLLSHAAVVSRVKTFSDGVPLFASDLNGEFNNLVNNVNALDNDNLSSSANISAAKISPSIAGQGVSRNGGTGALSVSVDNVTTEISSNQVIVKGNGIGNSQIRQAAGLSVLGRAANTTGNIADITAGTDGQVLRRNGTALEFSLIGTANIQNGAVTNVKLEPSNYVTSGSSGAYISSSTSYGDVTNLSVTITTTGRPVELKVLPVSSTLDSSIGCTNAVASSCAASFRIIRDGSTVVAKAGAYTNSGGGTSASVATPPSSLQGFEVGLPAGTYTYKVQAKRDYDDGSVSSTNADHRARISNVQLVAIELK
jgi:hypothetical protein